MSQGNNGISDGSGIRKFNKDEAMTTEQKETLSQRIERLIDQHNQKCNSLDGTSVLEDNLTAALGDLKAECDAKDAVIAELMSGAIAINKTLKDFLARTEKTLGEGWYAN